MRPAFEKNKKLYKLYQVKEIKRTRRAVPYERIGFSCLLYSEGRHSAEILAMLVENFATIQATPSMLQWHCYLGRSKFRAE